MAPNVRALNQVQIIQVFTFIIRNTTYINQDVSVSTEATFYVT